MSTFDDFDNSENPYAAPEQGGGYEQSYDRPGDKPLAGRLQRLGSQIADGLIGIPAAVPIVAGMFMADPQLNGGGGGNSGLGVALIGLGFLLLLGLLIAQLYFLGRDGQSIGKKIGKCRIVDYNNGELPGLARIFFLRMLLPGIIGAIPFLGMFFSLADPLFIFGEERRCIHDLIATTKVVEA